MKRTILFIALAATVLAFVWLWFFPLGQRPDRGFDASVASPAYPSTHPLVLFDEAHYNAHTLSSGYRAFAKLLENDGYTVEPSRGVFTPAALSKASVLVIVNANGGSNPKLFGINLEPLRKGTRGAPAFTAAEVAAIRQWVANGGSLLLVADHYPFGSSSAILGAAFGVTMHGGFVRATAFALPTDPRSIRFSRQNGLLAESPITEGRSPAERVDNVVSFTGQSLDVPPGSALLKLPPSAVEAVGPPPVFRDHSAGASQGAAFAYGRGRVVVLGEAAMLTAQVFRGQKFGMNVEGTGNRQFVLNLMHWLSRLI